MQAVRWAKKQIEQDNWVLLDAETTGLEDAEVVEIAIASSQGTPLINTLIKPTISIPEDAITKACGVSHPFVGKIRARLSLSYNHYKIERTVQRNGTVYTQNTAKIGSKADGEVQGSVAASNPQIQEAQRLESNSISVLKERFGAGGGLPLRARVVVTDEHPLFAGQHGTITGQPSSDDTT